MGPGDQAHQQDSALAVFHLTGPQRRPVSGPPRVRMRVTPSVEACQADVGPAVSRGCNQGNHPLAKSPPMSLRKGKGAKTDGWMMGGWIFFTCTTDMNTHIYMKTGVLRQL